MRQNEVLTAAPLFSPSTSQGATLEVGPVVPPGHAPSCVETVQPELWHNAEIEPIASTLANRVKLRIDSTKAQSGAPYYSCPGDVPAHRAEMLAFIND